MIEVTTNLTLGLQATVVRRTDLTEASELEIRWGMAGGPSVRPSVKTD